jgi:hypothetical protein
MPSFGAPSDGLQRYVREYSHARGSCTRRWRLACDCISGRQWEPKVGFETRQLAQRAIDQLGFVPNRVARSLVTRRNDSIGVMIAEPNGRIFGGPYFGEVLRGASARTRTAEAHPAAPSSGCSSQAGRRAGPRGACRPLPGSSGERTTPRPRRAAAASGTHRGGRPEPARSRCFPGPHAGRGRTACTC